MVRGWAAVFGWVGVSRFGRIHGPHLEATVFDRRWASWGENPRRWAPVICGVSRRFPALGIPHPKHPHPGFDPSTRGREGLGKPRTVARDGHGEKCTHKSHNQITACWSRFSEGFGVSALTPTRGAHPPTLRPKRLTAKVAWVVEAGVVFSGEVGLGWCGGTQISQKRRKGHHSALDVCGYGLVSPKS